jgi:signal transduction histidine kinase
LLGSWLRRVQSERSTDAENYVQASRLLSQLRDVSRHLSGGLDAVSLAASELESLHLVCPYERGSVFVRSPGGLLVLLATESAEVLQWQPDLSGDSPWADAWRSREPHRSRSGFMNDTASVSLVLPLRLGDSLVGLVGLERGGPMFDRDEVAAAMRLLDDGAARLDAALLFDEVRSLATAEERRRVAREIHDGIAQELASLGYAVDELTSRAGQDRPDLVGSLRELRSELSRVITELRLSIFDLRTDVGPHTSLTAVLADHARTVGAQSGLTVHLELAETPARLRVETETELLRIAQEAITNARKHAEARNLWVTCRIAAPDAVLRVEDDGRGITPGREDSFGFEIMRERAERVGGRLEVTGRPGGGTVVLVTTEPTTGEGTHGDQRAARR